MRCVAASHPGSRKAWACLIALAVIASTGAGGSQSDPASLVWRTQRMCGVNCLYLFLGFHRVKMSYTELTEELLTTPVWTSLADLQRVASRHGVACAVGRTSPEGLRAISKPLIAHWEQVGPDGTNAGHFVVVTRTTDDLVTYFDGTTAEFEEIHWDKFNARWTGYVLYRPHRAHPPWWAYLGTSALLGVCLGSFINRVLVLRQRGPRPGLSTQFTSEA
jgi:hypothetical protein